ncbi:hypothetical protein [Alteromonas sp. 14N.309.X.WAT.G.H12]|uniref:hypothetical protein n=1 Tax=Alteromonas sp. 14N.309.X.WAT.G.H12 TaxID=3120824 RepID=UPI002FD1006F
MNNLTKEQIKLVNGGKDSLPTIAAVGGLGGFGTGVTVGASVGAVGGPAGILIGGLIGGMLGTLGGTYSALAMYT